MTEIERFSERKVDSDYKKKDTSPQAVLKSCYEALDELDNLDSSHPKIIALIEMIEDYIDVIEINEFIQNNEETIPADLAQKLCDGENPIKLYRQYRGMTQKELAVNVGISVGFLADIENNRKNGSTKTLNAIAKALAISINDIMV